MFEEIKKHRDIIKANIFNSFTKIVFFEEELEKGKRGQLGEVREWKDGKYKKTKDGWVKQEKIVNKIDYDKIKQQSEQILSGEKYFERLSPEEEQGRNKGGRRVIESSILCGTVQRTDSEDSEKREEVIKQQEKILEQYARKENLWVNYYDEKKYWDFAGQGAEAKVYYLKNNAVRKVVDYQVLQETPLNYLDRLALHNYLFPEAPYKLTGFCQSSNGFCFIVEQLRLNNITNATKEEIKEEMEKRGFTDRGGNMFTNDNYIVEDLHTGNVVKDKGGNLFFIDPNVSLNLKEEEYEGKRVLGSNEVKKK